MEISIIDFAKQRNLNPGTVNAYIRKHPEITVTHKGRNTVIDTDSDAYAVLNKKYPPLQSIQVIEDTETMRQLIDSQKLIIALQEQLKDANARLAQAEATQVLLEDRTTQLTLEQKRSTELQKQCDEDQHRAEEYKAAAAAATARADAVQQLADAYKSAAADASADAELVRQQLERLRNRSLWQRIINKD